MTWTTRPSLALLAIGVALSAGALAQSAPSTVVALTPPEMKWSSQGAYVAPGMEQVEDRRASAPDVQGTRRRGGETEPHGGRGV